jgi:hypothetical protein
MFVTDGGSNYDSVCRDLLAVMHKTGAIANAVILGGTVEGNTAHIPLFGQDCHIRDGEVQANGRRLDAIGSILVARYLLAGGRAAWDNVWIPFRDLKDGANFATHLKAHIEDKLARVFSGRAADLKARLEALGGRLPSGEFAADVALVVYPFPRVPVLCLFYDRDEEFAASFQFLFDSSAPSYLDLESLAAVLQYIYLKVVEGA